MYSKIIVNYFSGARAPILTLLISGYYSSYSLYTIVLPYFTPSSYSSYASYFSLTIPQTFVSPN